MKRQVESRKYQGVVALLCGVITLLLCACGDEATPPATAANVPLPTITLTTVPTIVPLLPTVAPTLLTAVAAAESASASAASPLTAPVTIPITTGIPLSITQAVTVTPEITAAIQLTVTPMITGTPLLTVTVTPHLCAVAVDVALLSYPDLERYLGCPLADASFDPVAINEFGTGPEYDRFMLWFSSENQIYVLLPNNAWQVYPDTWTEEQPTFTCNPRQGEASSPPLPRRGFGKIWCTVEGLQSTLGTVEREERLCQHTVTQPFEQGRLIACYEDATIRFFRIMDNGSWDQVLTR